MIICNNFCHDDSHVTLCASILEYLYAIFINEYESDHLLIAGCTKIIHSICRNETNCFIMLDIFRLKYAIAISVSHAEEGAKVMPINIRQSNIISNE